MVRFGCEDEEKNSSDFGECALNPGPPSSSSSDRERKKKAKKEKKHIKKTRGTQKNEKSSLRKSPTAAKSQRDREDEDLHQLRFSLDTTSVENSISLLPKNRHGPRLIAMWAITDLFVPRGHE